MKKLKQYMPFIINILILVVPYLLIVLWTYKSINIGKIHNGLHLSLSGIIALIFCVIALAIHTILHEFGHLVTGLISGYKYGFFRIWKYALVKDEGKFKIKNFHIPGSLGQCVMAPPEKIDGDFPYLLYNLGGIISNGIFALIGLFIVVIMPINLLSTFFLAFGLVGLYLAITNGYPFEFVPNDGTNIKSLKRSEDSKKAFYTALQLTEMLLETDINKALVRRLVAKENFKDYNEPLVQNVISENVSLYIEEGELFKALEFSEFLLKQRNMTGILRNIVLLDKACIHLLLGHFGEIDKLMLDKGFANYIKSKNQSDVERYKFMYYTLYEKDEEKAKLAMKNYQKDSEDHLFNSYVDYDQKLIDFTLKKAKWIDKLEILDTVTSTNDYLKEKLSSEDYNFDYVLAHHQSQGKGQGAKSFYSPNGGMYLSVVLRPKYEISELRYLTGRAAVATVYALEKALGKKAGIKWINDIVFEEKKVGGILTESKLSPNGSIDYVIVGIGLNLKRDEEIPEEISSIYGDLGEKNVENATNSILYYLIPKLMELEEVVNMDSFLRKYNVALYRKNQFVHVEQNGEIFETILTGVNKDMEIITEFDGNEKIFSYNDSRIVNSDDISPEEEM